jgi:hypothetical protein
MPWTLAPSHIPDANQVALAIGKTGREQRHLGILYRPTATDPFRFLHLASHLDLRDEGALSSGFRCVLVVDLPLELHPTVVAQCKRSVDADLLGVPYGFGYKPTTATRDPTTGRLTLNGPSGLTCATFVLAIFELAGLQLADLATWRDRQGDDDWKERIIGSMANRRSAKELEAIRRDAADARVRPEDAAGAGTASPLPATFEVAVARGDEILSELS